jgi:hypothetical protein
VVGRDAAATGECETDLEVGDGGVGGVHGVARLGPGLLGVAGGSAGGGGDWRSGTNNPKPKCTAGSRSILPHVKPLRPIGCRASCQ